jgi:hypothetical protein
VVAFLGLAGAAAAAAVALHAPDDLREPREPHGPTAPAPLPDDGISRPAFGRLWLGALGAFGVLGLVPLISLARKPGRRVITGWRAGVRLVDENAPRSARPARRRRRRDGLPAGRRRLPEAPRC